MFDKIRDFFWKVRAYLYIVMTVAILGIVLEYLNGTIGLKDALIQVAVAAGFMTNRTTAIINNFS